MFHLFGIVLFIFLFAIVIVVASVLSIARGIFKAGKRMSGRNFTSENTYESSSSSYSSAGNRTSKKKKLFDKDEGEYVEFEEIKD